MTSAREPLPHWCANLRWKSHDADQHQPARLLALFVDEGELCTCLHTAQEVGFDDGPVSMRACGERRACYEPDARLVALRQRAAPVS